MPGRLFHCLVLVVLAGGGCGVMPTPAELTRANAGPLAGPDAVAGEYEAAAEGEPGVWLVNVLDGDDRRQAVPSAGTTTRPATPAVVRVGVQDGRLAVRLIGDDMPPVDTIYPVTFKNGYFRGDRSGRRPASPCVPAAYVAEEFAVGRRASDDALVVVTKHQAWMMFPVPFSSGPSDPWSVVFRQHRPATRPVASAATD